MHKIILSPEEVDESDHSVELIPLYVGSTGNIKKRFSGHHLFSKIAKKYDSAEFYFKECGDYLDVEKKLIVLFQPKYNVKHNPIYNPKADLK